MDKERRQHLRIYRNFIMSYYEKGKSAIRRHVSQVNNVSKGGLNFSSTHPIKEGNVIKVDLRTAFLVDPIQMEGVILECREKIPELIYEVRLKFLEVSPEAVVILDKIESYSKEKNH